MRKAFFPLLILHLLLGCSLRKDRAATTQIASSSMETNIESKHLGQMNFLADRIDALAEDKGAPPFVEKILLFSLLKENNVSRQVSYSLYPVHQEGKCLGSSGSIESVETEQKGLGNSPSVSRKGIFEIEEYSKNGGTTQLRNYFVARFSEAEIINWLDSVRADLKTDRIAWDLSPEASKFDPALIAIFANLKDRMLSFLQQHPMQIEQDNDSAAYSMNYSIYENSNFDYRNEFTKTVVQLIVFNKDRSFSLAEAKTQWPGMSEQMSNVSDLILLQCHLKRGNSSSFGIVLSNFKKVNKSH